MKERLSSRIARKLRLKYQKFLEFVIKKAVQKYDDLDYGGFLDYVWGRDDVTSYHVIAERSHEKIHVYGTKVERLIDGEWIES